MSGGVLRVKGSMRTPLVVIAVTMKFVQFVLTPLLTMKGEAHDRTTRGACGGHGIHGVARITGLGRGRATAQGTRGERGACSRGIAT